MPCISDVLVRDSSLLFGVYAFERRRFKWIDGNHENEGDGRQQRTRSRRKSADETQEAKRGGTTTGSVAYGEVFFATRGTILEYCVSRNGYGMSMDWSEDWPCELRRVALAF